MGSEKANIGKVLRIARIANNMTLKQASDASGVSSVYINELECQRKNNVSDEVLKKLVKAYDLTLYDIITLTELYNILTLPEERKFRRVLFNAIVFMEMNTNKK